MLLISNGEVKDLLRPDECIDVMEAALVELAQGRAINRPRSNTYFPVPSQAHPRYRFRFKSQEGGSVSAGVWALRIASDLVGVETLADGGQRRLLLPAAPGDRFVGFVVLFSLETLEPLAMIQDSELQRQRVAATSAVAIRKLSRRDARVAGILGSGWQARAHLDYLLAIRPAIETVRVFSPDPEHRGAFAAAAAGRGRVEVVPVNEARLAVAGCDIVVCATTTVDPIVEGPWPDPGAHVTSITWPDGTIWRREVSDALLRRAGLVVALSREQVAIDHQIDRDVVAADRIVELASLLARDHDQSAESGAITLFANNTGLGLQFSALGALVLRKAVERGVGRQIPTEWFLQETST